MRAMRFEAPAAIETSPLREVSLPVPRPGPREILVRVRVCGICRTDLHVVEGDLPVVRAGGVPGHQVVGTVEARGEDAPRFETGDRVGVAWLRETCGRCVDCRRGNENLCRGSRYTGYHDDGGYAEYLTVPEAFAYAIPSRIDDEKAAPLLCAGIIGYRALRRSGVQRGERLGLYGFGSSAHLTLQVARSWGCEVYVATRGEAHRAFARELGAVWVGDADAAPPQPLDGAILFAPAGPLVLPALRALRPGGTLAVAGVTLSPIPAMDYEPHLFHEKRLTSVEANTRADGEALLREAAAIPLRPTTVSFPLGEANRALKILKQDGLNGTGVLRVAD